MTGTEGEEQQGFCPSIEEIDEQCKALWPEWCPPPATPPPKKFIIEEKSPEPEKTDPLPTGSPKPDKIEKKGLGSKSGLIDENSREYVMQAVEDLKDEVQSLMIRIGETVTSPTLTPQKNKLLSSFDVATEEIEPEIVTEEVELEEPKPIDTAQTVLFDMGEPIIKTKAQLKAAIAHTQKQIKEVREENRALVKQMWKLKKESDEAQKRVDDIKKVIQRNEMLKKRQMQISSKRHHRLYS